MAGCYVVTLPAGLPVLSLNSRGHWSERARRGAVLKQAAWACAKQAKIPALKSAAITVTYHPPSRRHYDHDNVPIASGKYLIDGIVAAAILKDDAPPYVTSVTGMIGAPFPGGRFTVCLNDAVVEGGADAVSYQGGQDRTPPHRRGPGTSPQNLHQVQPPRSARLPVRRSPGDASGAGDTAG